MGVVHPVARNPGDRPALDGQRSANSQKTSDPAWRGKTLMRQEAVESERNPQAAGDPPDCHAHRKRFPAKGDKAKNGNQMDRSDETHVEPVQAQFINSL
jgi:hypothetical protein